MPGWSTSWKIGEAYEKFLVPDKLQFAIKTLDKVAPQISEKKEIEISELGSLDQ